jgi:broad specificity phosphatase PhoE
VELILVRHAQPDWTPGNRLRNDPELTELGRIQAQRLAERRWGHIDELWVSPMIRASQTAHPIAERFGLTPIVRAWMQEINNPPAWEGSPADNLYQLFAEYNARPIDELWDGVPGGESFSSFHQRVTSGVDEVLAHIGAVRQTEGRPTLWSKPDDRRIMLIAHGGTNAVILGHLLDSVPTPWEWERFDSFHSSVATLTLRPFSTAAVFGMTGFGDVGHLDPDQVTR